MDKNRSQARQQWDYQIKTSDPYLEWKSWDWKGMTTAISRWRQARSWSSTLGAGLLQEEGVASLFVSEACPT